MLEQITILVRVIEDVPIVLVVEVLVAMVLEHLGIVYN